MSDATIRFNDGEAYDQSMGQWSLLAGRIFIDWLSPRRGLRWIDVGCGSGAFSELLFHHCAPAEVQGIDPSEAQLVFARSRPGTPGAVFQVGDAMALPFPENRFDAAVMALVIFFVPEPAKGVAEMARVVSPGGLVAAYAWDMEGGGFPFEPIHAELRAQGIMPPGAPSANASRIDVLRELWTGTGLESVETREITVRRSFPDFEDFWNKSTKMGSMRASIAAMPADEAEHLKERVRKRLPADDQGRVAYDSRANAIKGRVPLGSV
jgi:ubiquinone/menaquinone biosynthesis C-methylase UbiE